MMQKLLCGLVVANLIFTVLVFVTLRSYMIDAAVSRSEMRQLIVNGMGDRFYGKDAKREFGRVQTSLDELSADLVRFEAKTSQMPKP
jgi:hypothetical protein